MRRHRLIPLTIAGALASALACSDGYTPSQASSNRPPVTPNNPVPPSDPGYDAVTLNFTGPGLVAGDSLVVQGRVHRGTADAPDTLAWATSDASIVAVDSIGKNLVRLDALRNGTVTISARTSSTMPELSSRFDLRVYAQSNIPSPVVVDDFTILQFVAGDQLNYQPMLRLRDTSAAATAKVIGVRIEVPEIGSSLFCAADHLVGAGWSAFNPPGDMNYAIGLVPQSSSRNVAPTVRVSVVQSDGSATSSFATGTIVPSSGWQWYDGTDTGVRCQY